MNYANSLASRHPFARGRSIMEANLPAMQRDTQEQARAVFERNVWSGVNGQGLASARRLGLELPQLRMGGDRR